MGTIDIKLRRDPGIVACAIVAFIIVAVAALPLHVAFIRWAAAAPDSALPLIDSPPPACRLEVVGAEATDGDTVSTSLVLLPCGVALYRQSIRASNYDAWEKSRLRFGGKTTDAEIVKGVKAKQALANILATGKLFMEPGAEPRDKYGRLLGRFVIVTTDKRTIDVAKFMREAGHCR